MPRRGEQISDAVAHQPTADDADFLPHRFAHVFPRTNKTGTATMLKRLNGKLQLTHSAEEETVMPALLWVAFWSSLMATAACFGEMSRSAVVDKRERSEGSGP